MLQRPSIIIVRRIPTHSCRGRPSYVGELTGEAQVRCIARRTKGVIRSANRLEEFPSGGHAVNVSTRDRERAAGAPKLFTGQQDGAQLRPCSIHPGHGTGIKTGAPLALESTCRPVATRAGPTAVTWCLLRQPGLGGAPRPRASSPLPGTTIVCEMADAIHPCQAER